MGIAGAGEERSVGVGGPVDTPSLGMTIILFSGARIGILHNDTQIVTLYYKITQIVTSIERAGNLCVRTHHSPSGCKSE